MHRIVGSHLKRFVREQEFEDLSQSEQFELFSNYCIVSKHYPGKIDLKEITTSDEDAGVDGVFVIADGEIVSTVDEVHALFSTHKRSIDIEFVFVQSKTSEKFSKPEISSFSDGVYDFSLDDTQLPIDDVLQEAKNIFDIVIDNVDKVRGGKPSASLYFVATGSWPDTLELNAVIKRAETKVFGTGFYERVSCSPVDRDELIRIWSSIHQPVQATVKVKGYVPYTEMGKVEESYIAIIPAINYVDQLLSGDDGKIISGIFDENVRAYLGEGNNVNNKIKETLGSPGIKEYFALLNNGITIVSPDVRVQNDTISIYNYQIVNGCQSSHVLFRNRDLLDDNVMVTAKVIEVSDQDVINKIVEATNNQSHVSDEKFLSLKSKSKSVELFFNSYNEDADDDSKIFFERRDNQYAGKGVVDSKIFDIRTVARAFASMFLEVPHTAASYPTQIFDQSGDLLFEDSQNEIAYYCATYALYKFNKLFNSKKLPGDFSKYRWHTLMILKYIVHGDKPVPKLNSRKIDAYCKKIIDELNNPRDEYLKIFEECKDVIEEGGMATKDRLKRSLHTQELKDVVRAKSRK